MVLSHIITLYCCLQEYVLATVLLPPIITNVEYYVSFNGTDDTDCGVNSSTSCGTLYYVSTKLQNYTRALNANIHISGQNETQITQYIINNLYYHPCYFIPLNNIRGIVMHFDDSHHWYPTICSSYYHTNQQYIFDISCYSCSLKFTYTSSFVMNNFIINHLTFNGLEETSNKKLIQSSIPFACNSCHFSDIIVTNINHIINAKSIYFYHSTFNNITSHNTTSLIVITQ
eukprot:325422_1